MGKANQKIVSICLFLILCLGSILIFEISVPTTMAQRKDGRSKINEYTVENERTHMTKENYLLESNDILEDNLDLFYPESPIEYDRKTEELPSLIVDYANMIRNDIILLDNSVETRTRKRGNIKVEKYNVPIDAPCTCEGGRDVLLLGNNYFPSSLPYVVCNGTCAKAYKCEPILYNYSVLKRSFGIRPDKHTDLHGDLKYRFVKENRSIAATCICKKNYIIQN